MKNLQLLKEEFEETTKYLNDISMDFINDNTIDSSDYVSDAFTEYSDSNVGIYYNEQRDFYYENTELCENAMLDLGYDLNAEVKNGSTLDDLICKAGVCGWYEQNYSELSEDEEDILKALMLKYCIDNEIDADIETINELNYTNVDTFDEVLDEFNSLMEE